MNKLRLFGWTLAILFGAFMVVYGGFDDSPGGQLLGIVTVIAGLIGIYKYRKKKDGMKNENIS